MSLWSGFYKKSLAERQAQLQLIYPELFENISLDAYLDEQTANNMIENCIGRAGLPFGLALNFKINSKEYLIPMAIEEPSVVAAVSGAAKLISKFGGFHVKLPLQNIVHAQVQLLDIDDDKLPHIMTLLEVQKEKLIKLANTYCQSMESRGGGVIDMSIRKIKRSRPQNNSFWLIVHFHIDTCDSMGANCASTVAEGMAPYLIELCNCRMGFRIVSNLSPERLSSGSFEIPVDKLGYKGYDGMEVATRIVEAYEWALDDPFRAVTHNKGVMNGIDAVAIASGQDWRAIEAASHAWTVLRSEQNYGPMTAYHIEDKLGIKYLVGKLELPFLVGTKGGALSTNPLYKLSFGLMGNPDSKTLAAVFVSVGLAQNFAALRALATEGIQRGHMSLHARNIALSAGAPLQCIPECVKYMLSTAQISIESAQKYLQAHKLRTKFEKLYLKTEDVVEPSMLYFEYEDANYGFSMNVAFRTLGTQPLTIVLCKDVVNQNELVTELFGGKSYSWLVNIFKLLDSIKVHMFSPDRSNSVFSKQLKLLSILVNLLTRKLYSAYPTETKTFLMHIIGNQNESMALAGSKPYKQWKSNEATHSLKSSPLFHPNLNKVINEVVKKCSFLKIGLPLLLALWQVFEARIYESVGTFELQTALLKEQRYVVASLITVTNVNDFDCFLELQSRRLQISLFLYCDAVTFDETWLKESTFKMLNDIGRRVETSHCLTHDLSPDRLKRDLMKLNENMLSPNGDLADGVSNSFLVWLFMKKNYSEDQIKSEFSFRNDDEWNELFESRKPLMREFWQTYIPDFNIQSDYLDIEGIKKASQLYQIYYDVAWLSELSQ